MKKCPRCPTLFADKANYCKVHRGKNPMLDKSYERNLLEYIKKRFPHTLEQPDAPLHVNKNT